MLDRHATPEREATGDLTRRRLGIRVGRVRRPAEGVAPRGVLVCDVQPPHTETGLATRPLAGTAPRLPQGLAPRAVAERIIAAIEADEPLVTAADFG